MDVVLERLAIAGGEMRELLIEEREEDLLSGARQIERAAAEGHGAVIAGGAGDAIEGASESVMPGMMGFGLTPTATPAERSCGRPAGGVRGAGRAVRGGGRVSRRGW